MRPGAFRSVAAFCGQGNVGGAEPSRTVAVGNGSCAVRSVGRHRIASNHCPNNVVGGNHLERKCCCRGQDLTEDLTRHQHCPCASAAAYTILISSNGSNCQDLQSCHLSSLNLSIVSQCFSTDAMLQIKLFRASQLSQGVFV